MNEKFENETLKVYEINSETKAIYPYVTENGDLWAKVYEQDTNYIVEKKPLKIIIDNCIYYGGSYEGKKEAARRNMGSMCFAPIMIDSKLDLYFFPLESPKNDSCIWLSQPHINKVEKVGAKKSRVIFFNGLELLTENSCAALRSKLHRAAQYRSVLNERTKDRDPSYT